LLNFENNFGNPEMIFSHYGNVQRLTFKILRLQVWSYCTDYITIR